MKNKIYLIDVSSLFFRAFYAVRPLTSPKGLPVNAIYGYLSMLLKLIKDENPQYIAFCYDRKDPSFRKDLYAEYKANRTEMPEDLAQQMPYIKQIAGLLGIPALEVVSYEADDLIGTLSQIAKRNNFQTYIVSGDKDFAQLVDESVILYDTMKNVKLGPPEVIEKWGVSPEQFIDYLALVGDSSDNIPGVKGIGPKGAIKLLQEFTTIEGIYQNIDAIKNDGLRNKLLENKDKAFLSKKLVTICLDVPMSQSMDEYKRRPFDLTALEAFFEELNFKSFMNQARVINDNFLQGPQVPTAAVASAGQKASSSSEPSVVKSIGAVAQVSPGFPSTQPAQMGFLISDGEAWTVITRENFSDFQNILKQANYFVFDEDVFARHEKQIFRISVGALPLHFIPQKGYDLKLVWRQLQLPLMSHVADSYLDTMLMAYTVYTADSTDVLKVAKRFSLVDEVEESMLSAKDTGYGAKVQALSEVHLRLEGFLKNKMQESNFQELYTKFERPVLPVLYNMEHRGISLNIAELSAYSKELAVQIQNIEQEIHSLAGESFNVASPKQLGKILFEKLGLTTGKKTKTGYSTDTDVLEKIEHPIAQKVLAFRELSKLKSTYVDALPLLVKSDGRIHTYFNQALTTTGRLSSINPNIQNIPIRTENGQRVRRAFQAAPGKKLLSIDYSQIELRILAHISGDPGLIQAFKNDLDIHAATAAEVFNVPVDKVTSDLRRTAKAINFGIAYGQGAFGLAENLGIPRKEAQEIISNYFSKFQGVHGYIESTIAQAHKDGFVETLFGRKRIIEELRSKNPALKKFGERAAINAPIQGSASDLVKMAMIEIGKQIQLSLLLQVHDELIFEGTESEIEKEMKTIITIMESIYKLKVPLKVNAEVTERWGE